MIGNDQDDCFDQNRKRESAFSVIIDWIPIYSLYLLIRYPTKSIQAKLIQSSDLKRIYPHASVAMVLQSYIDIISWFDHHTKNMEITESHI